MEPEGSLTHSKIPSPIPILSQINPVHSPIPLHEHPFSMLFMYLKFDHLFFWGGGCIRENRVPQSTLLPEWDEG